MGPMGLAEQRGRRPWDVPTATEMLRAELFARLAALTARISRIEVRLGALEGRNGEPSSNTATGVTPVTPDRNGVTRGSVTGNGAVTPIRNANAERQRRYRERKRQMAARL
jgi:hypothetical protein